MQRTTGIQDRQVETIAPPCPAPGAGQILSSEATNAHALAVGGSSLWVGCCRHPSLLLRLRPDFSGMEAVPLPAGGGLHDLAYDGRYLWVAHASGHVTRLDPGTDERRTERLKLASGRHPFLYVSHFDGRFLWLGTYTDPGRVLRLDPQTFEVEEHLLPAAPMWSVRALASAGDELWAGLYTVPGKAIVLNKTTGASRVVHLGAEAMLCTSSLFDGHSVWLGLDTMPAQVLRIDPGSGATERFTLHAGSSCVRAMAAHGGYLWLGCYTAPAEIVRLDPAGGQAQRFILPETFFNARAMVADCDALWVLTQNVRYQPSGVFRFSLAEAIGML